MISIGIRGAGVAGLSFAQALLRYLPGVSISLFDIRGRTPHPTRTFCFFNDGTIPLPVRPDHQWESVTLSGPNFKRKLGCKETPYSLIRGDNIFSQALGELEQAGVNLSWGHTAIEIAERTLIVDSTPHRFDLVIDAAFDPNSSSARLWQSFAGVWVSSTDPLFDPRSAVLMDLDVIKSDSSVRFIYLLPTSPTTALIEHTVFARQPRPENEHLEALHEWVSRQGYTNFEVQEREYGRIPMGLTRISSSSDKLHRLGTISGAVRASTGYAFLNIQRQSHQLALELASKLRKGGSLPSAPPPPIPLWMRSADRVFIEALARSPQYGQMIMSELLRTAPEPELIRFLAGSASPFQGLKVISCAPKMAMLKALYGA
jgi:lycopene beta-cyclase